MCVAGEYKISCGESFSQSFTVKAAKKVAIALDKTDFVINEISKFVVKVRSWKRSLETHLILTNFDN